MGGREYGKYGKKQWRVAREEKGESEAGLWPSCCGRAREEEGEIRKAKLETGK